MSESVNLTSGTTTRVYQRDIASRLGVSLATVSLALRDHPRISVATRETVKRMAKELGYQPIPSLRIFSNHSCLKRRSHQLGPLGWINAWSSPEQLAKHYEYSGYWKGACEAATCLGYRLEEFHVHSETSSLDLKRQLRSAGYHGLLLPPEGDPAALKHFPWENYHVVSLSHYTAVPTMHLVAPDRVGNCSLAFNMMRARGYRRIGFLTDRFPETCNDKLSVAGFLATQWELPSGEHLPVFTTQDHPLPHQLSQWVADHRPDAVLTDLPEAALLLKRAGLRVPQDLGLACAPAADSPSISHGKTASSLQPRFAAKKAAPRKFATRDARSISRSPPEKRQPSIPLSPRHGSPGLPKKRPSPSSHPSFSMLDRDILWSRSLCTNRW